MNTNNNNIQHLDDIIYIPLNFYLYPFRELHINNNNVPSLNDVLSESFNENNNKYINIVSDEGLELLQYIIYNNDISNNFEYDSCPISTEKFEEGETIVKLPCNHVFSKEPIMIWLQKESNKCPLCRYELPSKEIKNIQEEDETEESEDEQQDVPEEQNEHEEQNTPEQQYVPEEHEEDEDEDVEQYEPQYETQNNYNYNYTRDTYSFISQILNNNIVSNEEIMLQQALFQSLNN
jgi:hypothetical protein